MSDTLIELLSFSKEELGDLAKALELPVPRGTKFDMADELSESISLKQLRKAAGEHLGAGRTSMAWVLLGPAPADGDEPAAAGADGGGGAGVSKGKAASIDAAGDGAAGNGADEAAEVILMTGQAITIADVKSALVALTGEANPFSAQLRPTVTAEPDLVNVQHDPGGDLVFFTFAHERARRMVLRDFTYSRQAEDDFFHVVLRLSRGVMEVRADARVVNRIVNGWIRKFAKELGRREQRLYLTQRDVYEVGNALGAQMDRHEARHEDPNAGYGRQTVTAGAAQPDLRKVARFNEDFKDSDPVSSDLLFDYTDAGGNVSRVRIRISPRSGTVRCVSHVSNDVMEHVYDTLRNVRDARVKALLASAVPPPPTAAGTKS